MPIKINYDRCGWKNNKCDCDCSCEPDSSCKGCAEVCPVGAIVRKKRVEVNNDKCISCGLCVKACPNRAISLS